LYFFAAQKFGEIAVGHHRLGKVKIGLVRRCLVPSSVQRIQLGNGAFRPNTKASHVSAGRQRREVQFFHVEQRYSGDIAKGLSNSVIPSVNDARTRFHHASSISHFSFSRPQAFTLINFFDIRPRFQFAQDLHRVFGSGDGFHGVVDDERNFRDFLDLMTFGHDEGGNAGGRYSRRHGEALLVGVDAVMPTAPRFSGSEHTSAATHVAEGTLAGAVRAAPTDAWNTGDGATRAPRFG